MKLGEAINKLVKDNKKSHASLAKMMGRKTSTYISNICIRNNTNVNTLLEITDVLGYEVIIKPKSGDDKAERTIRLERCDTDMQE
jgi:hypothetical protein